MDSAHIVDGLLFYLGLIVLLTFHEFAHAWVASLCGDDTARVLGRLSLNPVVHMDPIGTVALPLIMIFCPQIGGFLIGWAKPVPVSLANLRHPIRDDVLIALAGPAMNVVLAVVFVLLARIGLFFGSDEMVYVCMKTATLSLLLCFFNLIPIPPLDGSHVLRSFIGMSWESYMQLCRFGIIAVLIAMRLPFIQDYLVASLHVSLGLISSLFGADMRDIASQFA